MRLDGVIRYKVGVFPDSVEKWKKRGRGRENVNWRIHTNPTTDIQHAHDHLPGRIDVRRPRAPLTSKKRKARIHGFCEESWCIGQTVHVNRWNRKELIFTLCWDSREKTLGPNEPAM